MIEINLLKGMEKGMYNEDIGTSRKSNTAWENTKDVLKRTRTYYNYIGNDFLSKIIPVPSFKRALERSSEKLPHYDKIRKEHQKGFFKLYNRGGETTERKNVIRVIKDYFKEGSFLDGYEKLWAGQNRPAKIVNKAVYKSLGGNNKPVKATMGTFGYSGFALHALNPINPYTVPSYALGYYLDKGEGVVIAAAAIIALHLLLGAPVAYKKWRDEEEIKK